MKQIIKDIFVGYLSFWAKIAVSRSMPFIIGVTGSSGKTTLKYLISKILDHSGYDVQYCLENLNSETGLPISILGEKRAPKNIFEWLWIAIKAPFISFVKKIPKYLVLEYAADKPGDIEFLASKFVPDIAVISSIGVSHIEMFGSEKEIAKEKWTLCQRAKEYCVINDKDLNKVDRGNTNVSIATPVNSKILTINKIKQNNNSTTLEIKYLTESKKIDFPFLGDHNINNLKLALLATHYATGGDESFLGVISKLDPLPGRGQRFVGRKDLMVIDESYNANPESMLAALKNLESISYGRKVAILGSMKEIGKISNKSHAEIARIANKVADVTVGVGVEFQEEKLDYWYNDVGKLNKELWEFLQKGDVVLIKGSHSNHLEKTVEKLR